MIDKLQIEQALSRNGSDKHIHGYHEYYESVFNDNITSLFEIGIKTGASLLAWYDIFPSAKIAGMDINLTGLGELGYIGLRKRGIKCFFGNSIQKDHCERLEGNFDIIIDDGSHFYIDIMATFDNFKDKFNKYYIIEDSMYDHEGVVDFIKSKGFSNVEVYDSKWKVNVPVPVEFLKYGTPPDYCKNISNTINTTLKWIKVTR